MDREEILKDSEPNFCTTFGEVEIRFEFSANCSFPAALSVSGYFDPKGTTVVRSKVTVEVVKREAQVDF